MADKLHPEIVKQMRFIQTEFGRMSQLVMGGGLVDMKRAKQNANLFREMRKKDTLDFYDECQRENISPFERLEQLDPTPRDDRGNLLWPCDAFTRLANELGFNQRTTVDQLLTSEAQRLVPALMLRWFNEGVQMGMGVEDIWSFTEQVEGMHAHPIAIEKEQAAGDAAKSPKTNTNKKRMGAIGKSGLPRYLIGYQDADIALGVFGCVLDFNYSTVRHASSQKLRRILNMLGLQAAYDDLGGVWNLLKNGDAVSDAPPARLQISGGGGAGVLVWDDLTGAMAQMAPYRITHWVTDTNGIADMLNLSQLTGPNFRDETLRNILDQKNGAILTPIGWLLVGSDITTDNLGFFDRRFAFCKAVGQALLAEADKIIAQRWEEVALSEEHAYYLDNSDACGNIDYSA